MCPKHQDLLNAYSLAVTWYERALKNLKRATPGNVSRMADTVGEALRAVESSRAALERHCSKHRCDDRLSSKATNTGVRRSIA